MELFIGGLTLGCIYALVAGGFVLVFRGTSVLNFAQGPMVLFGGYLVYEMSSTFIGFWGALVVAMLAVGLAGWAIQRGILTRLAGRPLFTLFLVTFGLNIVFATLLEGFRPWSDSPKEVAAPAGHNVVSVAGSTVPESAFWIIGITAVIFALLALFLRYSSWGLAMQVTAMDNEVATILGIPVSRVFALSWFLAGALAAVAGAFLGSYPRLLEPSAQEVAMRAIPAAILGGIDSFAGAGIAAVLLGLIEVYTSAYQPAGLGANFHLVMPYIVMFIVLLVRPQGFFGTREREVERV